MRLLGWVRRRLHRCDMGRYGCNRRPVGTWDLDGFRVRLCADDWDYLCHEVGVLGVWTADIR